MMDSTLVLASLGVAALALLLRAVFGASGYVIVCVLLLVSVWGYVWIVEERRGRRP